MATGGFNSEGEVYGSTPTPDIAELGSDSYRSTDGGNGSDPRIQTHSFSFGSEEGLDFKCTRCEGKGKQSEAKFYCTDCDELYCSECIQIHSEISVLRRHVILGEESKRSWGNSRLRGGPVGSECDDHGGQIVSMYCEEHDALCCPVCVAMDHRQCEGMTYLPLISKGIFDSRSLKKQKRELNDLRKFAEEYKSNGETMKSNLGESTKEFIMQLTAHRDKIDAVLKELQNKLEQELGELHRHHKEQIDSDTDVCIDILDNVNEQQKRLTDTNGISEPEMFVRMKSVNRNVGDIQAKLYKLNPSNAADQIKIIFDNTIINCLEKLSSMGHFVTSCSDVAHTRSQLLIQAQMKGQRQVVSLAQEQMQKNIANLSLTKNGQGPGRGRTETDIQIRLETDQPDCSVESMCQLDDGTIVVADSCNASLKLLDPAYTVKHHVSLSAYPYAICCTDKHEVAVGLSNNAVQIVQVQNGHLLLHKLYSKVHQCCSMAFGNNKLYVSQYHGKKIFVYDYPSPRRIMAIERKYLSKIKHLQTSRDCTMLYVSDLDNGIVVLNITDQANYTKLFGIPTLCDVGGICLDNRGDLLVTDRESQSVVRIRDKTTRDIVISGTDVLQTPGAVLFDVHRSKLLVFNGSRGTTIKVFNVA